MTDGRRRYPTSLTLFHLAAAEVVGLCGNGYLADRIIDLDGPLTTGEIARRLGLTTGATTRVIDRLVEGGRVRRVTDPADRRRVLVEHADTEQRFAQLVAAAQEPIDSLIASMSEGERQVLHRYFDCADRAYTDAAARLRE